MDNVVVNKKPQKLVSEFASFTQISCIYTPFLSVKSTSAKIVGWGDQANFCNVKSLKEPVTKRHPLKRAEKISTTFQLKQVGWECTEDWPEQESLCRVWSHHPMPAHHAMLVFYPIFLGIFTKCFTFILLSYLFLFTFLSSAKKIYMMHFSIATVWLMRGRLICLAGKLLGDSSSGCNALWFWQQCQESPEGRLSF